LSTNVGAGRLKILLLLLLYLVAIGFAAVDSRTLRTSTGETRSGS